MSDLLQFNKKSFIALGVMVLIVLVLTLLAVR